MEVWIETTGDKTYLTELDHGGDVFETLRWCCINIDAAGGAYGGFRMLPGGMSSKQDPMRFIPTKEIRSLVVRDLEATESITVSWQNRIMDRIALSGGKK